jgi:MFS family permease
MATRHLVPPEADLPRLAARTTRTLFAAQSLGSAAFLVASTVSPLVATELGGAESWAGVPTAVYMFGSALAAFAWGRLMDPLGRRATLALGMAAGLAGAATASASVEARVLAAFLAGVLLMGTANSALQLARFVSAEVHPPERRGRAIANVVVGGAVGAMFGPLLAGPAAAAARSLGLAPFAGPYAASAAFFVFLTAWVALRLRPEPAVLARAIASTAAAADPGRARPLGTILDDAGVRVAVTSMVFGQVVMTMLMVITAVHMRHHHHGLAHISAVLSAHVLGMYLPSLAAGQLTDRWGRHSVIVAGGVMLALSTLAAAPSTGAPALAAALFLLGVGWNFCFVGGSALLADRLTARERARTQGASDTVTGLVAAAGSLASGFVFSRLGYAAMALVSGLAALLPVVAAMAGRPRAATVPSPGTS